MLERYRLFLRGLATNWIGATGVVLTTTAFVLFLFMEILLLLGVVTNAYVGLITYLALPLMFIVGLVLIPVGWRVYRRATGLSTRELLDARFPVDMIESRPLGSRVVVWVVGLTLLNLLFLGAGTGRMMHYMDQPVFCGTACHEVMHPEWTTYQQSPHARVKCVDCHVGEGAGALIDAKLNGLWQIVSATFDLYDRPIPTPVHQLRPARETCEECHWPEHFYGTRINVATRHEFDESSTALHTTLALKVGSGSGEEPGQIHWHIAEANQVRYASVDDRREEMVWVEVRKGEEFWRYTNRRIADDDRGGEASAHQAVRTMDCVDCHNRATHIYESAEGAVDRLMAAGALPRGLPFAKRQYLAALSGGYADTEAAMRGIERSLYGHYSREYPRRSAGWGAAIDTAVEALQGAYRRNVHPRMNVSWGSYPDHRGHRGGGGCFRCHNPDLVDSYGEAIPYDCTLCHSILSFGSPDRFQFLQPVHEEDPDRKMHRYLQSEFLETGQ
jgi:hypothetical protein